MIIQFLVPTAPWPVGGAVALYQFANGLARGGHTVRVGHLSMTGSAITADDLSWFSFDDRVIHQFSDPAEPPAAAPAFESDIVFAITLPRHCGLPVSFVQGSKVWPEAIENQYYIGPFPKICIAEWLVDVGLEKGVPAEQLIHIPYGLDHQKYRLTRPVEGRPPRVAVQYNAHPSKGLADGFAALEAVKQRVPELEAVVFGAADPEQPVPEWITYLKDPDQGVLVDEVYNGSSIFLCSSIVEGFGLPALEAMACGAALVVTANGGSADYAIHGETALVCEPGDVDAMAAHIESLVRDDALRSTIVAGGLGRAADFDWDVSASKLAAFLEAYLADPEHYQRMD